MRLEFRVAHPGSPAEFGLSEDVSKYGIIVSSVRLHAENWISYQWGDKLSLVTDKEHPVESAATSGFTAPTPNGVYTLGPAASIRLRTPPPTGDMVLEVDAGAFLVDTRLPEQRVGVVVNGHALGEWTWKADTPQVHTLLIPKEDLNGRQVRLEFHIARPGSPAEFGISADVLKYEIWIYNLRLYAAQK